VTMASPTFQKVSGMQGRRIIEPTSAVSEDDTQEDTDMARRRNPMEPGPERDRVIVDLYQQGHSLKEIREHVGLTYDSAIYMALKNAGVATRNRYNTASNGTITEDVPETVEVVAVEVEVPISVVTAPEPADMAPPSEPPQDGMDTYVLRVWILPPMEPTLETIEVDAANFDAAYEAAKSLPGLVKIEGVVRRAALQPHDGDA
jgi:hypothetical protein